MNVQTIADKVRQTVAIQLGRLASLITAEQDLVGDLGADSLDLVELVMQIEDDFNLEICDDEAQKLQTVGQIIEYVESRMTGVGTYVT